MASFIEMATMQQLEIEPAGGLRIQDSLQRVAALRPALIREMRHVVLGLEASAAMHKKPRRP